MASSTHVKFSLSLLFLFIIFPSLSYSRQTKHLSQPLLSNSHTSSKLSEFERLIRSFNLFPKAPVNIIASDDNGFVPGRIVETEFSFLGDDGPSVKELGHHAGYYSLPHSKAARLFYFFFESRNSKDDPVVIWLTGGPGCSSEIALFYENGPFKISNNLNLVFNQYGWDQASNILFIDQPTGTGFSYSTDSSDLRHDETGVSNDLYDFLQAFFKEHPQFVKNDFFITGESYAGHYVPAIASRVNQGNKKKEGLHINLKGFAIGNGLTNPAIQYAAYGDYAVDKKLITKDQKDQVNDGLPRCEDDIKACESEGGDSCETAYSSCTSIFNDVLGFAGDVNYYDVRKKCDSFLGSCYDFSNAEKFLNLDRVKNALGVGNLSFVSCSNTVYSAMKNDWMKNLEVGIPSLLEDGIRMLVYAGEEDLICNWLGNFRWVQAMEWSGQKDFKQAPTVNFTVDGALAGLLTSHGPLSFLKVIAAGHMVPMDQPKAALEMLRNWMAGKLA